jgi:hypothetical protein
MLRQRLMHLTTQILKAETFLCLKLVLLKTGVSAETEMIADHAVMAGEAVRVLDQIEAEIAVETDDHAQILMRDTPILVICKSKNLTFVIISSVDIKAIWSTLFFLLQNEKIPTLPNRT